MFPDLTSFAAAILLSSQFVGPIDPMEEIYAAAAKAKAETKALVVEFEQEESDRIERSSKRFAGKFRLLKTEKGEWNARLEILPVDASRTEFDCTKGWLVGNRVLEFKPGLKMVREYPDGEQAAKYFFDHLFFPALQLVDRTEAQAKHHVSFVQRDEWYSYIRMKPKPETSKEIWPFAMSDIRLVTLNKGSESIPQSMPRQLAFDYSSACKSVKIDILTWRINPDPLLSEYDFQAPALPDGWQLIKMPPKALGLLTPIVVPRWEPEK